MKKIAVTLAVVLGLGLTQVNAQTLSGGVKVNANMSNFLLSDMNYVSSNFGFGASLGGFLKVEFNENFALQPEVIFHLKNSEMESSLLIKATTDYQYWGAEIPVYAVGQMALGSGRGFAGVGPYVGLGFSAKYNDNTLFGDLDLDLYKKNNITDEAAMKRFDFGFGALLGYEFSNKIIINASYQMGLLNLVDAGSNNTAMRNQAISLGVGYRF